MVQGSSSVGQHGFNRRKVGTVNGSRAAQLTLVLRGFLGQDMTLKRLTTLDGSATAHPKALRSAFFGFHLGHDYFHYDLLIAGDCPTTTMLARPDYHLLFSLTRNPNQGKPLIICRYRLRCPAHLGNLNLRIHRTALLRPHVAILNCFSKMQDRNIFVIRHIGKRTCDAQQTMNGARRPAPANDALLQKLFAVIFQNTILINPRRAQLAISTALALLLYCPATFDTFAD